jgi:thioredoxin reductase (NADPH)
MPPPETQHVDALIVGGGPAGLTCAIYLARYRRKVVVVDGRKSRAALIPETHNYPGFADGIAGPRLLDRLHRRPDCMVSGSFMMMSWRCSPTDLNS